MIKEFLLKDEDGKLIISYGELPHIGLQYVMYFGGKIVVFMEDDEDGY